MCFIAVIDRVIDFLSNLFNSILFQTLTSRCRLYSPLPWLRVRMNNAPTSDDYMVDVGKRTNQMSETGKSLAKVRSVNFMK